MAGNLEARQDQSPEFDQINQIDANDVEFDMDQYKNLEASGDELTEAEKKEYEKLNKKFNDLQYELYKIYQDPDCSQVHNIMQFEKKQSYAYSQSDGRIRYVSEKGDDAESYVLIGSTNKKRPALFQEEYKGNRFHSKKEIKNNRELSVEAYEQMLKKVEESVNEQKKLLAQVKNQNKNQESNFINNL